MNHVKTAQAGHLQVEQHEIRTEFADLPQSLVAVFGFTHDFHVRHRSQFVAEDLAGHGLVIDDQSADGRSLHHRGFSGPDQ